MVDNLHDQVRRARGGDAPIKLASSGTQPGTPTCLEVDAEIARLRAEVARLTQELVIWKSNFDTAAQNYSTQVLEQAERAERAEAEVERWRHGATIEGDFVCPNALALSNACAQQRELLHRWEALATIANDKEARLAEVKKEKNECAKAHGTACQRLALAERLAEALAFYAEKKNWEWDDHGSRGNLGSCPIDTDAGHRARDALAAWKAGR